MSTTKSTTAAKAAQIYCAELRKADPTMHTWESVSPKMHEASTKAMQAAIDFYEANNKQQPAEPCPLNS